MSNSNPSQALAPAVQQPSNALPSTPPANGAVQSQRKITLVVPKEKGDIISNFNPYDDADAVELSRAMSPSDASLEPYVGKTISVVGVVLNMAEFESDQVKGEMIERVYASIVLADGTVVGTTGKAVMGQLAFLIGSKPSGKFDPPVEYEVRSHDMPKPKKPYFSLRRVLPPGAKGGKAVKHAV